MIRLFVCLVVVVGFFTVLHGNDDSPANPILKDLHKQRCELLAQNLDMTKELHATGKTTTTSLDEAKIRLFLAEAEAATDEAVRQRKQDAAIDLLREIVDRSQKSVPKGLVSLADYREAQLRLIETKISFLIGI